MALQAFTRPARALPEFKCVKRCWKKISSKCRSCKGKNAGVPLQAANLKFEIDSAYDADSESGRMANSDSESEASEEDVQISFGLFELDFSAEKRRYERQRELRLNSDSTLHGIAVSDRLLMTSERRRSFLTPSAMTLVNGEEHAASPGLQRRDAVRDGRRSNFSTVATTRDIEEINPSKVEVRMPFARIVQPGLRRSNAIRGEDARLRMTRNWDVPLSTIISIQANQCKQPALDNESSDHTSDGESCSNYISAVEENQESFDVIDQDDPANI